MVMKKVTLQVMVCFMLMVLSNVNGMEQHLLKETTCDCCERPYKFHDDGKTGSEYCQNCLAKYDKWEEKTNKRCVKYPFKVLALFFQTLSLILPILSIFYTIATITEITNSHNIIHDHEYIDGIKFSTPKLNYGEFYEALDVVESNTLKSPFFKATAVLNLGNLLYLLLSMVYVIHTGSEDSTIPIDLTTWFMISFFDDYRVRWKEVFRTIFYTAINFFSLMGGNYSMYTFAILNGLGITIAGTMTYFWCNDIVLILSLLFAMVLGSLASMMTDLQQLSIVEFPLLLALGSYFSMFVNFFVFISILKDMIKQWKLNQGKKN